MWFTRYVLFKLNLSKHFQRPAKGCTAVIQSAYTLLQTFQMWTHLLLRAIFRGRTTVSPISQMRTLNNRKIRDSPKGTHLPCGRRMSGLVLKHLVLNYWMSLFISTNWPDFPGREMIWWKLFILLLFLSPHHPIFPFLGPLVFTTSNYLICITRIGSWRRILQILWVIYLLSSCKWNISKGQRVFICFLSFGGAYGALDYTANDSLSLNSQNRHIFSRNLQVKCWNSLRYHTGFWHSLSTHEEFPN